MTIDEFYDLIFAGINTNEGSPLLQKSADIDNAIYVKTITGEEFCISIEKSPRKKTWWNK